MAKIQRLSEVSIYTRNAKRAREFYTKKVGLTVRSEMPEMNYLNLGATKGGEDAGISVWQPRADWEPEMREDAKKSIGGVTGIGFLTADLDRTVAQLKARGVKVEKEGDTMARFWDPDGNILFIQADPRAKAKRAGLQAVSWVTVATRDAEKAGAFFRSLGMKPMKVPAMESGEGRDFFVYQFSPKGTAIMPFAPRRDMYDNAEDYETDVAHIGEHTGIAFQADDTYKVQEKLLAQGVAFKDRAEKTDWGGVSARIYDSDRNHYQVYHMEG